MAVMKWIAVFLALWLQTGSALAEGRVPQTSEPKDAPAISWQQDGKTHSLNELEGQAVIVHFWATWCAPCVVELPEVAKLADSMKGKKIRFVTLSLDTKPELVKDFYKKKAITSLPVLMDTQSEAFRAAEMTGLPGTLFIDANGKLAAKLDGVVDWQSAGTKKFVESLTR